MFPCSQRPQRPVSDSPGFGSHCRQMDHPADLPAVEGEAALRRSPPSGRWHQPEDAHADAAEAGAGWPGHAPRLPRGATPHGVRADQARAHTHRASGRPLRVGGHAPVGAGAGPQALRPPAEEAQPQRLILSGGEAPPLRTAQRKQEPRKSEALGGGLLALLAMSPGTPALRPGRARPQHLILSRGDRLLALLASPPGAPALRPGRARPQHLILSRGDRLLALLASPPGAPALRPGRARPQHLILSRGDRLPALLASPPGAP